MFGNYRIQLDCTCQVILYLDAIGMRAEGVHACGGDACPVTASMRLGKWLTTSDHDEGYDLLQQAVVAIRDVPGLTCEIGVRGGGGSEAILRTLAETGQTRWHIAVDPYGSLPYAAHDPGDPLRVCRLCHEAGKPSDRHVGLGYDDSMRDFAVPTLGFLAGKTKQSLHFFIMTDKAFMAAFPEGVPVMEYGAERLENRYALVHFDGPHDTAGVLAEAQWFHARAPPGAVFVFDDTAYYDHGTVDAWLLANGWQKIGDKMLSVHVKTEEGLKPIASQIAYQRWPDGP